MAYINTITPACINEVMNCQVSKKDDIKVGIVATMFVGSDRYAMVVTEVFGPKKIKVDHMSDLDYEVIEKYTDENNIQMLDNIRMAKYAKISEDGQHWEGTGKIYTLRKNGRWMPEGMGLWETCSVHLGHAENYMDPSF